MNPQGHPLMTTDHIDRGIGKKPSCARFCLRPVDIRGLCICGLPIVSNQVQVDREAMISVADLRRNSTVQGGIELLL